MKVSRASVRNAIMSIAYTYRNSVARSTKGPSENIAEDISYWREKLFTKFITFLLPTCLIALVPGVFMALRGGFYYIAFSDIIAVTLIAFVSLNSKLSLVFRKGFVVAVLYLLSIALLVDLSLLGPGIVYLLALSVVITVIFPRLWGYWSVAANFLICVCCAILIHFKLFDAPLIKDYALGTWIAVSSNLVFLSFVVVILVSNMIKGFEKVIKRELQVKNELQKELAKVDQLNMLLTESESHFKSLFYQNPSPMWVLDATSLQFLQVNDSAIQEYGYTNDEFMLMNVKDIKQEQDMPTMYSEMHLNTTNGKPASIITKHRKKNDEFFFAEVTFNSILFKATPATLVISQNVNEQVNYVHAIERQNETFKEIAWIQSHKVRGPLATILGLAQLLDDKATIAETALLIDGILVSSKQLDGVVREIVAKTSIARYQIIPANHYAKMLQPAEGN